ETSSNEDVIPALRHHGLVDSSRTIYLERHGSSVGRIRPIGKKPRKRTYGEQTATKSKRCDDDEEPHGRMFPLFPQLAVLSSQRRDQWPASRSSFNHSWKWRVTGPLQVCQVLLQKVS